MKINISKAFNRLIENTNEKYYYLDNKIILDRYIESSVIYELVSGLPKARKEKNISLRYLSDITGISFSVISKVENFQNKKIPINMIKKLYKPLVDNEKDLIKSYYYSMLYKNKPFNYANMDSEPFFYNSFESLVKFLSIPLIKSDLITPHSTDYKNILVYHYHELFKVALIDINKCFIFQNDNTFYYCSLLEEQTNTEDIKENSVYLVKNIQDEIFAISIHKIEDNIIYFYDSVSVSLSDPYEKEVKSIDINSIVFYGKVSHIEIDT